MKKILFLLCLLFHGILTAQSIQPRDTILADFEAYATLPREVVFVHLNKSVYIKGENIGYKAYVLDKDSKKRSFQTKNLYCVLIDEKENVVKKQLIGIENGIGSGIFELDSLFTTGTYKFQAYTNWMRNFSEPNYFQQPISVIDPEITKELTPSKGKLLVDAQFLPESGQALVGVNAVFGAIIKDENGYGYPYVEGKVIDTSGDIVAEFKVNEFGIGRFAFIPQANTNYIASFTINNTTFEIPLEYIREYGITCNLQDLSKNLGILLNSNFANKPSADEPFMLTIHNGDSIKAVDISFRESSEVIKVFRKNELYRGLNIFTLFDQNGIPLLERLFFNHQGLEILELTSPSTQSVNDSVKVNFSVRKMDTAHWNSLSVSVLPEATEVYKPHHNLPSYSLLNPYIKGPVENAFYYFTSITPRKKYELDNLLITQGWSSYKWNNVLTKPPQYLFDFEKGITFTMTPNQKSSKQFLIFPSRGQEFEQISMTEDQEAFTKDYFFPLDDEKLRIAELSKLGGMVPAKIFVRFKPSAIPPLQLDQISLLGPKTSKILEETNLPSIGFEALSKLQILDEVILLEERTITRMEEIRQRSAGEVDFFEDNDLRRNQLLSTYLTTKGYNTLELNGTLTIQDIRPNSFMGTQPIVYLDGILLANFDRLYQYTMDEVDYIEINKTGRGAGLQGGGGIIKIVTDPFRRNRGGSARSYKGYDIPLTFTSKKRYTNPIYISYTSNFYKTFGAIDWFPNVVIDKEGRGSFTFYNYGQKKIKLFIEGIVNDHQFLSDVKVVTINK